ncbi:MAG: hypothetical protein V1865_01845 [bacterium]
MANKTGDNVIVFDPKNGEPYVIVSLKKYEMLAKKSPGTEYLTEQTLTDKINPDMANWENEPNFSDFDEYQEPPLDLDEEDKELMNFRPEKDFEPISDLLERKADNNWQIPKERKALVEEDEQYLEEITF